MPPPRSRKVPFGVLRVAAESYGNTRGRAQPSGRLLSCASILEDLDEVWAQGLSLETSARIFFCFQMSLAYFFISDKRKKRERKERMPQWAPCPAIT